MTPQLQTSPRTFAARVAELGFSAHLPTDWISHELPAESVDFSDPTAFMPLAVVTAPHSAIFFAFAARPAYDDGTLQDWAWYHLNHHGLQPRAVGRDRVAGVPAVVGEALQPSEAGPMVVRFAFLEDGNRLLNLSFTAPEILADAVRDAWFRMLATFTLETPRGSRFQWEATPDDTPAAPIPEPWQDSKRSESASTESPASSAIDASSEDVDRASESTEGAETEDVGNELEHFALADDAASLGLVPAENSGTDAGETGSPPAMIEADDDGRRATVESPAIRARFDVPYGWHVLDDRQRVLVFDPKRQVRVRMELMDRAGRDEETLLDAFESEAKHQIQGAECERADAGRIRILRVMPVPTDAAVRGVLEMLLPYLEETKVLRARVDAVPSRLKSAERLTELMLDNVVFDAVPPAEEAADPKPASTDGRPEWWHQALVLEAANQLEAAERLIRERCPYIGFAHATADMYRQRMGRLLESGDHAGAREAFFKASAFIRYYASLATSGGEGLALSDERDQFRAQLVKEFGGDPEAKR